MHRGNHPTRHRATIGRAGIVIAFLAVASLLASGCWLSPSADAGHTSFELLESTLTSATVDGMQPLWSTSVGRTTSSPITDSSRVYTTVGDPADAVVAVDPNTGAIAWTTPITIPGRIGSPRLTDDNAELVLVQPTTGGTAVVERLDTNGTVLSTESIPAPGGSSLEVTSRGGTEAVAVSGPDGIELRYGTIGSDPSVPVFTHEGLVPGGPVATSGPQILPPVTMVGNRAFLVSRGTVYAFSLDGPCAPSSPCAPIWNLSIGAETLSPRIDPVVQVDSSTLAVMATATPFPEAGRLDVVSGVDPATGSVKWLNVVGHADPGFGQPAADGSGRVFVAAPGRVDVYTGDPDPSTCTLCHPIESIPDGLGTTASQTILAADVVYVDHGATVEALPNHCTSTPCAPLWTQTMPSDVQAISVSDGHLLVATASGLYAFGFPPTG